MAFKPNNAESLPLIISNIQNCVIDIKSWMTANMLQLNMDKTEVLVLMNKSLRNPITMNKIKMDSIDISTASSVRTLGAISAEAEGLYQQMLPRSLSKPMWCPKSTIATACCTASQINYWIVFSEFRTMLLGWSSDCINSAISHQHWPHYTGSLSIAGLISR